MSQQIYNPESDTCAQIERLEMSAREIRRRIEHVRTAADRRVLNRQIEEIKQQIIMLQSQLP